MTSPSKHQVIRIDYSDTPTPSKASSSSKSHSHQQAGVSVPLSAPSQELRRQRLVQFWRKVMIFGMLLVLLAAAGGILFLFYRKRK